MIFVQLTEFILKIYQNKIDDFFRRNYIDNNLFHPHELSYLGLNKAVLSNPLDYYVILIHNNYILSYGLLRGWQDGFEIPSLGIMVDKNHRGKGISIKMMSHLHETAGIKGSSKIRLSVYKINLSAINLYSKLGYVFSDKNHEEYIGIKELKNELL